jgi:hypothetical protein
MAYQQFSSFLLYASIYLLSMKQDESNKEKECMNCQSDLDMGRDAIGVELGVIGPRGFIPLDDKMLFCCEKCVKEYVNGNSDDECRESLNCPRRKP